MKDPKNHQKKGAKKQPKNEKNRKVGKKHDPGAVSPLDDSSGSNPDPNKPRPPGT